MRVLLQNTETKLYYIGIDQWTDDPAKATDFQEIQNAADAYDTEDLTYARIVVDTTAPSPAARPFAELFKTLSPTF